jgi:hypothetical protein
MKTRWILPAVYIGLAALVAIPVAQADRNYNDNGKVRGPCFLRGDTLVGTWRFTLTGGGPAFDYLVFHEGNTLTERVSDPKESMGSGVWEKIDSDSGEKSGKSGKSCKSGKGDDSGAATYAATFETFSDPDFNGVYDARTRVRLTFQLNDDTISGTGTIEIRTLDNIGLIAGPFTGFTYVANRMTVIPQ